MSAFWTNDADLYALARRELYTAVVGDIMDQMGLLHQFLPPQIRPLDDDMIVIGSAMTVVSADIAPGNEQGQRERPRKPFGLMLEALDDLRPHEVYLASGSAPLYALWGELMSARAIELGAAGAVINGYSRDTRGIRAINFPTFSYGSYAQDQAPRGEVLDFRVTLQIGQTCIAPGDVVFGDIDGVCIIPVQARDEVFRRALEKVRGENQVRAALQSGMSAGEAFKQYGIL